MLNKLTPVTVGDETHTVEDWVKFHPERNLTVSAVLMRVKKGMTQAEAVTLPRLWHRGKSPAGVHDRAALRAKEDLESFEHKKPEKEPEYEWRFIPYTSYCGEYRKVQIN